MDPSLEFPEISYVYNSLYCSGNGFFILLNALRYSLEVYIAFTLASLPQQGGSSIQRIVKAGMNYPNIKNPALLCTTIYVKNQILKPRCKDQNILEFDNKILSSFLFLFTLKK